MQGLKLTTLLVFLTTGYFSFNNNPPKSEDNGQNNEPQILHPGTLSNDLPQWNNYFNRKLSIGLCTQLIDGKSRIIQYPYADSAFSQGSIIPFKEQFEYASPWVNLEGDYMLLQANIGPLGEVSRDFGICESRLVNGQWTQPKPLNHINNMPGNEGSPALAENGNLYFNAQNGNRGYDIFVLKKGATKPVALPEAINSTYYEGDFYIDKDEKFIVFSSADRPDGQGSTDLYISFNENGRWTKAVSLGNRINTAAEEFSPYVSMDRRFLVFTSNRNYPDGLIPSYNHFIVEIDLDRIKQHFGD
ncbi:MULTISPECIES: PD40 domain-containing protein [Roseivirga]|jgi:hypothetical protein|uniref:WD40-like Beta Propeller Repeat n=1 Tax=Roseivirga thermotolerans TaxID=1758176 RepID=A0ABQ3IBA0_9BACT|nr:MULTISPECIES: PD40 domain-containing protein [Roseivirga]MEC7755383.1 PD40 domain-containing protein [Bacteroidota bacterium]GHE73301.1 hypothetical protein GCM10011340_32330 [Roseivirga thermotolerans]|tara:strand:- start:1219 stop:2124 length:906 start_codon:yes stop_codon:yes gene_type:complete